MSTLPPANDTQKWLYEQGYYRDAESLCWMKNGRIVSGEEIWEAHKEYKELCKGGER